MSSKKGFELHQVLNYRTDLERLRKQEFAAARQDLDQASDKLEQQRNEAAALARDFAERNGQLNSVVELQLYADFFARKREEIKQQQERVTALDRILEDRRDDLVQATKDKKVLEALKEKKMQAFRQEMQRKERDFLDETAVQKKGRD
ncbi:flagellar export protein FliJ [Trichlorobacter sp.]|jgi:flagellar FliJ protein|uniref:flagellar export protein FliJ n=1 Tax=Trichlorobacter sp. TaxID=2911007 RepID=UPI002A368768|nr:flagellar export protein FliJ [Trichlorobacter sp.]MDY0383157.1 flagellar export protein FliJ [Trichlorobacter sp.]